MRRRKMGSKDLRAICTVCRSTTSMDLITSRFTPNRAPGNRLIWRSKLNLTSSAVSSPKPLWNCTPFLSLNVQIVPSGESVQLSARSGSTSAVVTLPSLMAKRVSPRNMKRAMACDCPSVLECGSRVSGSLAAMFSTFFRWASAGSVGPSSVSATRTVNAATSASGSRDRMWRNMGFSSFADLFQARIERVAQTVAEEIEAEHGDEDCEAGEERQPGVRLDEGDVGLEVPAPAGRRRLGAQAEEAEGGLDDDRRRDAQRGGHDDGRQAVRQDVAEEDPGIAHPEGAAGLDVLLLLDGQHAAADEAGGDRDAHDGDCPPDLHRPHETGRGGGNEHQDDGEEGGRGGEEQGHQPPGEGG